VTQTFNLADVFESVADVCPDRTAVATPNRDVTFAELDERANRLAHHLEEQGIGAGDHVALLLQNGTEYLEAMLGAFKLRAVPINVNYRYVERELAYLLADADAVALVGHRRFLERVEAAGDACPKLRHLVSVDDGSTAPLGQSVEYESALASASPARPSGIERSGDDLFIAYTGGTTGLPKGVVWRHEDLFFGALGGGTSPVEPPADSPADVPARVKEDHTALLVVPPLMHVAAQWAAFSMLVQGNTVVLTSPGAFDPVEILGLIAANRVMTCLVVGDAMARPLADAMASEDQPHDLTSLRVVASGGAGLSTAVKEELRSQLPDLIITDGYGSTETGVAGFQASLPGQKERSRAFNMDATTTVLDDDGVPVSPGSGTVGRLARRGHLPMGYYNDEEKTAATFREIDGVRWVLPGDMATVESDGTITLLGRGSVSINTGGEKVFPEEVEEIVIGHPSVFDALVIGLPDQRWGSSVTAVVSLRPDAALELSQLREHCRADLADYKLPRRLVVVPAISRGPNGKPDYPWALETAAASREDDSL